MLQILRVIHTGLFLGPTFFLGIIIYQGMNFEGSENYTSPGAITIDQILIGLGFLATGASLLFNSMFSERFLKTDQQIHTEGRLNSFKIFHIIRTALLDQGVLIGLVGLFMLVIQGIDVNDYKVTAPFYVLYALFVMIWLKYFPKKTEILQKLKLTEREWDEYNRKSGVK